MELRKRLPIGNARMRQLTIELNKAREAEDEAEEKLRTWMVGHLLQREKTSLALRSAEDLRKFSECVF
ncbi:hypothetical protein CSUI_006628, partial [Cystoisospora suis]